MSSACTSCFRTIPSHELRERVFEIYRYLGDWLLGKNQGDIEQRYREIGERRARQKIPLAEVIQAIVLTKENLWEFLKSEAVWTAPWKSWENWNCCRCSGSSLIMPSILRRSVPKNRRSG